MKTSDLIDPALDWTVARLVDKDATLRSILGRFSVTVGRRFTPTINWAQGGPIIERERLQCSYQEHGKYQGLWACNKGFVNVRGETVALRYYGPTLLISAMRCYVASKLGDEVDIPEELL